MLRKSRYEKAFINKPPCLVSTSSELWTTGGLTDLTLQEVKLPTKTVLKISKKLIIASLFNLTHDSSISRITSLRKHLNKQAVAFLSTFCCIFMIKAYSPASRPFACSLAFRVRSIIDRAPRFPSFRPRQETTTKMWS